MDLFNGETGVHFLIAVVAVGLALVAYTGVLKFLRDRPVAPLLQLGSRERVKRLTVADAAIIDTKRRIVLIRRDNVEHLVLIGGPTDVVIESRITSGGLRQQPSPPPQPPAYAQPEPAEQAWEEDLPELAQPVVRRPAPPRPQASAPASRQAPPPAALPSEDNDYTYGPDAILSARDFQTEPARRPQTARAPETRRAEIATAINDTDPETILQMLRARILGDDVAGGGLPALEPARKPEPQTRPREDSAFARVLNDRMQEAARPPAPRQQPQQPARETPAQARERSHSQLEQELEVARILEELQQRRRLER